MFYDEKDADIVFHFCVANFHDNIVVLDTDEFEVFLTISIISFTFRLLFSQNIVQNPQIRLRETKIKHLKKRTLRTQYNYYNNEFRVEL